MTAFISHTYFFVVFCFICAFLFLLLLFTSPKQKINIIGTNNTTKNLETTTHSLAPIASNQWYSSVYKKFPSQPLYAFPIAYQVSPKGLSFSYPDLNKTPQTIFGTFNEDFVVGIGNQLKKPEIKSISDWSIGLEMKTNDKQMDFLLAHGIPYTIINTTEKNIFATFPEKPEILSNISSPVDLLTVKIKNHYYSFVFPKPVKILTNNSTLTFQNAQKVLVGLLDKSENDKLFKDQVNNDIASTIATPIIEADEITTSFAIETKDKNPLIALLPHQYENLAKDAPFLATYKTLRGDMKLIEASKFEIKTKLITPDESFSKLSQTSSDLLSQLESDVDDYVKKGEPESKNYFFGAWLGKGTTLLQLSQTLGQKNLENELRDFMSPIFIKSLSQFSYNKDTTSIIAHKPEFGNEKNNDHHFHYGYLIRAAAILSKDDPAFFNKVKHSIDEFVLDIANTDRASEKFPYIRNFDPYESHSWADGNADFFDGNNQESSSEAINAWYGVYLWSKVTQDKDLEKTALYLYNSEILGTQYYWFGKNNMYAKPYEHAIASLVWGGKVDFATWFSGETNMKYGILLLPITPGSNYLSDFTNFEKYENDFLSSGGSFEKSWGDLFLIFKSFHKPNETLRDLGKVGKSEDNTPRSVLIYTLLKNSEKNEAITMLLLDD